MLKLNFLPASEGGISYKRQKSKTMNHTPNSIFLCRGIFFLCLIFQQEEFVQLLTSHKHHFRDISNFLHLPLCMNL